MLIQPEFYFQSICCSVSAVCRLALLTLCGLVLACSEALPVPAICAVDMAALRNARIAQVVDGDTLHLKGGDKVRMIGINAPERGRDGQTDEPLAMAATRELESLVGPGGKVKLQYGRDSRDHYGRRLAHVFAPDGGNLQAELLRRGLAFHVAVAPNFDHLDCLRSAEQQARSEGQGVWSEPAFRVQSVKQLRPGQGGFTRVRGEVTRVSFKDNGWWVQLGGKLGVQIKPPAQSLFERSALESLEGREVEARGWLVPMKGGWWMMNLGHPSMLNDSAR